MGQRPKCKTYNYEMCEKFHGIGFGSDFFFIYDTKGTGNKRKIRQIWLPQNLKLLCIQQHYQQSKRQPLERKKIFDINT